MNTQVTIKFPKCPSKVNLHDWEKGSYGLVFQFLQSLWADSLKLMSDISTVHDGDSVSFMGTVTSFSHIFVKGIHYGSAKHHQGKSSKYAYINGREAVEIQYLFVVTQELPNHEQGSADMVCTIVRHFQQDEDIPAFPWDLSEFEEDLQVDLIVQGGWFGCWFLVCRYPQRQWSSGSREPDRQSNCVFVTCNPRDWLLDYCSFWPCKILFRLYDTLADVLELQKSTELNYKEESNEDNN